MRDWFESFISSLTVDQMMMATDTAPKETTDFYKMLVYNKPEIHSLARNTSSMYFLENILTDYLKELKSFGSKPISLAFDFSDAKILVWAQIKNDDEKTEDALILSEAKANAKYSENGFYISSTIVEEADNVQIPGHYKQVSLH